MKEKLSAFGFLLNICLFLAANPGWCQSQPDMTPNSTAEDLDLSPEIIKNSPVLQWWQRDVPNIFQEIKNDNIAPVVGYRHLQTNRYTTDQVNLGAKLLLVLSRGGAYYISLTQSWVSPGSGEEVGLTQLSLGYAVTSNLRLSTDIHPSKFPTSKR